MGKVGAVIVAAGRSTRMGGVDKTFIPILGVPLVAHTLDRFESSPQVDQIVLVLAEESLDRGWELVQQRGYRKVAHVCAGGRRRQDSVRNGLELLSSCDWDLHSSARDGPDSMTASAIMSKPIPLAIEHPLAITLSRHDGKLYHGTTISRASVTCPAKCLTREQRGCPPTVGWAGFSWLHHGEFQRLALM